MLLKIETKIEKEIDLQLPAFFRSKNNYTYCAVLSETDYREVSQIGDNFWIEVRPANERPDRIASTYQNFDVISEVEFFEKYNSVLEALSLKPELINK